MPPETLLIFALAAMFVGLSKGGLGGPVLVTLTAPLLSLVLPLQQAVGIVLPLLIFADMIALRIYWRTWDITLVRRMLPLGVVGTLVGTVLLAVLPNNSLAKIVGLASLIAVVYKVLSPRLQRLRYEPRNWHAPVAGAIAGLTSALANAGAPPFTAYMLLQPNMTPQVFLGTTTLFFAVVNLVKVPGFLLSNALDLHLLAQVAWMMLLIPIGVFLGRQAVLHMNPRFFERLILGTLFVMSVYLLVR